MELLSYFDDNFNKETNEYWNDYFNTYWENKVNDNNCRDRITNTNCDIDTNCFCHTQWDDDK